MNVNQRRRRPHPTIYLPPGGDAQIAIPRGLRKRCPRLRDDVDYLRDSGLSVVSADKSHVLRSDLRQFKVEDLLALIARASWLRPSVAPRTGRMLADRAAAAGDPLTSVRPYQLGVDRASS